MLLTLIRLWHSAFYLGLIAKMKYDLKDFQLLEAIYECGSFAKAAEQLHRTPSAVTQHIQKLEQLLDFEVFDRTSYRPTLTKKGQLFLERGRQILKYIHRLDHDLKLIKKGWESEFAISYDDLIAVEGVYSIIQRFQKIAPHVTLRLHREVLNGCWDALLQNRSTLVIGASGEPPMGLPSDQKTIGEVNFIFVVAPQHPLAKIPDPISKEEIIRFHSVVISDTSVQLPIRSSGILPEQPILLVPNLDAKIRAQALGLGVGYLPKHRILELLNQGKLVEKKVNQQKSKTHLKMAWRTDTQSQVLKWFLHELNKKNVQKALFK